MLQIKQDLQTGKLTCENSRAAELAALVIQCKYLKLELYAASAASCRPISCDFFTAEMDDYDENVCTPSFVSQYRFLPEKEQTEQFELLVLEEYKKLS